VDLGPLPPIPISGAATPQSQTTEDGSPVVEEMTPTDSGTESEAASFEDDSFAAALAQYQSRGMKKHNILPEKPQASPSGGGEMGSGKILTWDESRKVYLDQRRIKSQWRPIERLWEIEDIDESNAAEIEDKVWKEQSDLCRGVC